MKKVKDKRIKTNGLEQILIDLKPRRCDADVYLKDDIDVTELDKYIKKAKKEGKHYTYFQAAVLAFAKTIYNRRKLNRYVRNRHIYEHGDVVIAFVAKIAFDDHAEEVNIQVPVEPDDNMDTVSEKISDIVNKIRSKRFNKEGANSAIDVLGKLPNFIRIPLIGLFKFMDKKGILPNDFKKDDIYFSSAILTDIGIFKIPAIYHNNTDFGTCSSITAIGEFRDVEKEIDGKKQKRKVASIGVNLDERIADGFYMIKSYKLLDYILQHPELLERPAAEKIKVDEKVWKSM